MGEFWDHLKAHFPVIPAHTQWPNHLYPDHTCPQNDKQYKWVRQCPTCPGITETLHCRGTSRHLNSRAHQPKMPDEPANKQQSPWVHKYPRAVHYTTRCLTSMQNTWYTDWGTQRAHIRILQTGTATPVLIMVMSQEEPVHWLSICADKLPTEKLRNLPQHIQVMQEDRTGTAQHPWQVNQVKYPS